MRTITARKNRIGIVGRASIGLAIAAIAVTTLGAASASAATRVTTVPVRHTAPAVHTAITAFPVNKGAHSAKVCKQWTGYLNEDIRSLKGAVAGGDKTVIANAVSLVQSEIESAEGHGCAVITG